MEGAADSFPVDAMVPGAEWSEAVALHIVTNDPAFSATVGDCLRSAGFQVMTHASGPEFVITPSPPGFGCVIVDHSVPECDGLALLRGMEDGLPLVLVGGQNDALIAAQAMKLGAVQFLAKPVQADALLAAVHEALALARRIQVRRERLSELRRRLRSLTAREKQVLEYVVRGKLNKQIALGLGTAEHTVKIHRGRVMQKMHAESVAQLVLMAVELGLVEVGTIPLEEPAPRPAATEVIEGK